MQIPYLTKNEIENKRVLLRTDYNVSLNLHHHISNTERIQQSLPTIKYLLKGNNRIRIISHLGRPEGKDDTLSLKIVVGTLEQLLPDNEIIFAKDFFSEQTTIQLNNQTPSQIVLFENVRFEKGEIENDESFSKMLSSLGQVFVNNAFACSHRNHASIVSLPKFLLSFIGLQFEKEIEMLRKITINPNRPFVAIIGGSKTDKINLLEKLSLLCDDMLIGGKFIEFLNNNPEEKNSLEKNTNLVMSVDFKYHKKYIADIGEKTILLFRKYIEKAKTIFWNGPMGIVENDKFQQGTREVLNLISSNKAAYSVVGGGDTITAIAKDSHIHNISYVSTSGGALIEYIETGTLPGIKAISASFNYNI
ncbi:hypothetical protein A2690_03820 [Candidatus Roizmanbacteria bacterium RIFCSPHIGHO2_01_FULL_39_12b]|uniref:Phosphoglycerate kinase n=1 Tax=Candidatus Roizmanbacteria bacterium RIFCSPHIGHO2_01_FULL_39_12b TaxID=1802030 RepID=A0A1F7GBY5_9BACT|nr:MAG: hypothetical protein A2690_03820 [Candidatus Roizmanbacteria bacterium RIFCSPHIGHO2_01_FULL_39_12b]OGK47069.1 MAG: hypothetical protein A3B46_01545 [Candidatus Roizmanbacteria bacterium RIFCSPLOWO2_01_FULL_39_19]